MLSALCRHVTKDKVGGALSQSSARCLMKMAAKSGNVGVFNKAKETVQLGGKVSTTTMRTIDPPESVDR